MNYRMVTPSWVSIVCFLIVWAAMYVAITILLVTYKHGIIFSIMYIAWLAIGFATMCGVDTTSLSVESTTPYRCPHCGAAKTDVLINGIPFGKSSVTYACTTKIVYRKGKTKVVRSLECCEKDDMSDTI